MWCKIATKHEANQHLLNKNELLKFLVWKIFIELTKNRTVIKDVSKKDIGNP